MQSRTPVLFVALIALTFFAGCGGKTTTPTTSDTAPAMTAAVDMKSLAFSPKEVTIAKGGTVTWTNKEALGHDVTADDGSFSSGASGAIAKDGTFAHTFANAGTFTYKCKAHGAGMSGTVIVK